MTKGNYRLKRKMSIIRTKTFMYINKYIDK